MKCTSCKNYHKNEGTCIVDESPVGHGMDITVGHGMDIKHINEIWGLTFEECKLYDEKPLKELKMCSCAEGWKMKIEDNKLLCAYCGKEIEGRIIND